MIKQRGVTTLIITVVLLFTTTLIILFAASYSLLSQKITSNQYGNNQAFEAAEAGLEYGIEYLKTNSALVLANTSGGHLLPLTNSNTTNVSLGNNSKYSFVFTNPTANNYNLILVTSTGTNYDGTSTRIVSQLVYFGSLLFTPPQMPIENLGSMTLSGNSTITNTSYNNTITSGSTVSLSGNVSTVLSSGVSSTPGHMKSDITQNASNLSSLSQGDFFATFFGVPESTVKSAAVNYISSSSSTNYSSQLNGLSGTTIWIDQNSGTASITGNTVIGTAANPVLLVVNGPLSISGNVTIYGLVVVLGSATATDNISGNVNLQGAILSSSDLNISGNTNFTYNSSVMNFVKNQTTMTYYAKVPGSWKDF